MLLHLSAQRLLDQCYAIMSNMAVSPECCLSLKSVGTGQTSHDHKLIAADIESVIQQYESTDFTDNTFINKKAWTLLQHWFPSLYFQSYCSHGLHPFVNDVFAETKTKRASDAVPTQPCNYPFEEILVHALLAEFMKLFESDSLNPTSSNALNTNILSI